MAKKKKKSKATKKNKKGSIKKVEYKKIALYITLATFFILILTTIGLLYKEYRDARKELDRIKQDPEYITELQQEQTEETLRNLREIMLLPNEKATIATIIDPDSLREENEAFYKDAEEGDKLIIYSNKAIIYREQENKIINVVPVFIEPPAEERTEESN